MNQSLVVVNGMEGAAGAVVWWSLTGLVDLCDLEDAWSAEGMDTKKLPEPPREAVVVVRGVQSLLGKDSRIESLARRGNVWEVETTATVMDEEKNRGTIKHHKHLRIELVPPAVVGGGATVKLEAFDATGEDLKRDIPGAVKSATNMLHPTDISQWLIEVATRLHAVGLRDRGGFYFIPRDRVAEWTEATDALMRVSKHRVYSLPAMDCADAVETILTHLQAEAAEAMKEMERYLLDEEGCSTRGLNSLSRNLAELQAKVAHYAVLLRREMPELDARAEKLLGATQAARLVVAAAK